MDFTRYFLLPDGHLRAGWRLLLFLVFFVAAAILFSWTLRELFRHEIILAQRAIIVTSAIAGLAAVGVATWLMMSLLEHQPFWACGLALGEQSLGELAIGLAGGTGLVGTVTIAEWTVGAIQFQPSGTGTASSLSLIASSTAILAVAAASEELLFRGYPFQRLVEGTNGPVALALTSIVFGGLHFRNPHATHLSTLNTMMAGVLLSLAYLKTRALWLPIGFHFSWNWSLALAGLPVSGMELATMPWRAVPASSHIWLHGGDYGPEGGIVATGALIAGIVCLVRMQNKQSAPPGSAGPQPTGGDQPPLP